MNGFVSRGEKFLKKNKFNSLLANHDQSDNYMYIYLLKYDSEVPSETSFISSIYSNLNLIRSSYLLYGFMP